MESANTPLPGMESASTLLPGMESAKTLLPGMESVPTTPEILQVILPTTPENLEVMGSEFTTPEHRPNYDMRISSDTKKRVQRSSPSGVRCLITNGRHSVEYCHCIPRRILKENEVVCL